MIDLTQSNERICNVRRTRRKLVERCSFVAMRVDTCIRFPFDCLLLRTMVPKTIDRFRVPTSAVNTCFRLKQRILILSFALLLTFSILVLLNVRRTCTMLDMFFTRWSCSFDLTLTLNRNCGECHSSLTDRVVSISIVRHIFSSNQRTNTFLLNDLIRIHVVLV
jgi:hypothetical protein